MTFANGHTAHLWFAPNKCKIIALPFKPADSSFCKLWLQQISARLITGLLTCPQLRSALQAFWQDVLFKLSYLSDKHFHYNSVFLIFPLCLK